jgi:Protein of unknown function (DUF2922)
MNIMAKTIELHFINSEGKVRSLSVDNPKEPVDPVATKLVMDTIIAANIFAGSNMTFVSAKEVRLVEHNVTGYELV